MSRNIIFFRGQSTLFGVRAPASAASCHSRDFGIHASVKGQSKLIRGKILDIIFDRSTMTILNNYAKTRYQTDYSSEWS